MGLTLAVVQFMCEIGENCFVELFSLKPSLVRTAFTLMATLCLGAACNSLPTASPILASSAPSSEPLISTSQPASNAPIGSADVPVAIAGGCGKTTLYGPPGPSVALVHGLDTNEWAVADPASAGLVAYFWGKQPHLIISSRATGTNKILWVSDRVVSGVLTVRARPIGGADQSITAKFPSADSPLGNYPSGIDLPTPGCWNLDLTLGDTHASIDVLVAAHP